MKKTIQTGFLAFAILALSLSCATFTKLLTGYWAARRVGLDRQARLRAGTALVDGGKVDLVRRLAPCFLRRTALNFAGTVGSPTYDSFASGRYAYWLAVLRKD